MAISIKFTKFDNTPWGFRLAGGSDFPQPLTVIRVAEGSLAECMGLKVGDVVVRLNDQSISNLTHGQAHEALLLAGNNFTLGVHREEDPLKAVEAISGDNIVPYKIPLDQLPPVYPENILLEETVTETRKEEEVERCTDPEVVDVKPEEEVAEKPKDADSEVVPNKNLTDDEIAQLILEEEELLIPEQGVLGVNFKKLRPRLPNLKESKVVEELQSLAAEDPPRLKERKHVSTFLQKPQRPIPLPRSAPKEPEEPATESYKVVIKKQEKKSVTKKLLEKGLLHPGPVPTPEYRSEVNMFVPDCEKVASENDAKATAAVLQIHDESPPNGKITMNGVLASRDEFSPVFADASTSVAEPIVSEYGCSKVNTQFSKINLKRWPDRRCFRAQYFKESLYWLQTTLLNMLSFLFGFNLKSNALKKRRPFKGHYFQKAVSSCWNLCSKFFKLCFMGSYSPKKKFYVKARYCNKCLRECRDLCLSIFKLPVESALGYASAKLSKRKLHRRGHYLKRNLSWYRDSGLKLLKLLYPSDRQSIRRSSIRMKGRYFETCLRRDSVTPLWNLRNLMDEDDASKQLFSSFLPNAGHAGSRRSSCSKAHYGERILVKNVKNIGSCFQSELYHSPNDSYLPRKYSTSRRNSYVRAHYAERVMAGYLESLGLFMGNLILTTFERRNDTDSRGYQRNCSPNSSFGMFLDSIKDTVRSEIFHRGNRKFSRLYEAARALETRHANLPTRRESADFDVMSVYKIKESLELTESFAESAEKTAEPHEYKEEFLDHLDDNTVRDVKLDEYLYEDEERISEDMEDREMSDISTIQPDEQNERVSVIHDDMATSDMIDDRNILQPGESSDELIESSDISIKDTDTREAENIDENEHLKTSTIESNGPTCRRKMLIFADEKDAELIDNPIHAPLSFNDEESISRNDSKKPAEDNTVSWNSFSRSEQSKDSSVSDFLSSTKDYISMEVFHRGARRRSSRSGSVSSESGCHFGLEPGKYSGTHVKDYEKLSCCNEADSYDRENRRLSFVPTILYEGITRRIGVDFTKLFVYGFVPCTSIVFLYVYKSHYWDLPNDSTVH